jgi:hypothetical protein
MHAVYFPLTYLTQKAARRVGACFSNVVVYQAMKAPEETRNFPGFQTVVPVSGDEQSLRKAIESYKAWAELHQGEVLADFKARMDEVPFYNENSIAGIKTELLKRSRNESESGPEEKTAPEQALFAARLFLAMAHEHDAGEDQLQEDLKGMKTLEQRLFDELKGETEDLDEELSFAEAIQSAGPEDPVEDFLADRRMAAWVRLALSDSRRTFVYVTPSRAALDFLLDEALVAPEPLLDLRGIPVTPDENPKLAAWKQDLFKILEDVALNPDPSGKYVFPDVPKVSGEETASLTVYRAPNMDPAAFLTRLTGQKDRSIEAGQKVAPYQHTLVCLVS